MYSQIIILSLGSHGLFTSLAIIFIITFIIGLTAGILASKRGNSSGKHHYSPEYQPQGDENTFHHEEDTSYALHIDHEEHSSHSFHWSALWADYYYLFFGGGGLQLFFQNTVFKRHETFKLFIIFKIKNICKRWNSFTKIFLKYFTKILLLPTNPSIILIYQKFKHAVDEGFS